MAATRSSVVHHRSSRSKPMPGIPWALSPDRCFDADPARRAVARGLYAAVKDLPLVCPHGHVPPALLDRFQIELLCTTDAATDTLDHHRRLHADGLRHIRPTFRPDALMDLANPAWRQQIAALSDVSGIDVVDYASYIRALEQRR